MQKFTNEKYVHLKPDPDRAIQNRTNPDRTRKKRDVLIFELLSQKQTIFISNHVLFNISQNPTLFWHILKCIALKNTVFIIQGKSFCLLPAFCIVVLYTFRS